MLTNLQHFLFFLFITYLSSHSQLIKANIYIYAGCSQEKYQPNSIYESTLNSLLSSFVSSSSQTLYNSFAIGNDSSTSPENTIYGLYQCRGDLKTRDCSSCVASAVSELGLVCPYTYGGTLQLDTCFVRYEHIDFLGKADTSLRYKRCSKSLSDDSEFLKRRDYVLEDLKRIGLGFRVSVSGSVEGFAQCLGDLNGVDCSSCVGDAVLKLKSLCGSAEASDVFLAQCYARYWASGYYDSSRDMKRPSQETAQPSTGKMKRFFKVKKARQVEPTVASLPSSGETSILSGVPLTSSAASVNALDLPPLSSLSLGVSVAASASPSLPPLFVEAVGVSTSRDHDDVVDLTREDPISAPLATATTSTSVDPDAALHELGSQLRPMPHILPTRSDELPIYMARNPGEAGVVCSWLMLQLAELSRDLVKFPSPFSKAEFEALQQQLARANTTIEALRQDVSLARNSRDDWQGKARDWENRVFNAEAATEKYRKELEEARAAATKMKADHLAELAEARRQAVEEYQRSDACEEAKIAFAKTSSFESWYDCFNNIKETYPEFASVIKLEELAAPDESGTGGEASPSRSRSEEITKLGDEGHSADGATLGEVGSKATDN